MDHDRLWVCSFACEQMTANGSTCDDNTATLESRLDDSQAGWTQLPKDLTPAGLLCRESSRMHMDKDAVSVNEPCGEGARCHLSQQTLYLTALLMSESSPHNNVGLWNVESRLPRLSCEGHSSIEHSDSIHLFTQVAVPAHTREGDNITQAAHNSVNS